MNEFSGILERINAIVPDVVDELDIRLSEIMYQLYVDAQSGAWANYLELQREEFFAGLYEFSYGISYYDTIEIAPTRTDVVALSIIHQKELYEKRIKRLRGRYARFNRLLGNIAEPDKQLILGYFEGCEKVEYELLRSCITRNLQYLERFYEGIEKGKNRKLL